MERIRSENLRAYLEAQRGAVTRIARECGVDKSLVSNWKAGKDKVPVHYNDIIARILGRELDDLTKPFSHIKADLPDLPEIRTIVKILPSLSESGLDAVLETALQQKRLKESSLAES